MNSNQVISSSSRGVHRLSFALTLALAPALGCGFLTVNGKTLGSTTSTTSTTSSASSTDGSSGTAGGQGSQGSSDRASPSTAASSGPASTKRIEDIKPPEPTAALSTWTAAQQWMPRGKWGGDYGYSNLSGAIALADELGDRLSQLGRVSLIASCFEHAKEDATSALIWAICGNDVAMVDLKKLAAELAAEGIGPASQDEVMAYAKERVASAKKVGAAVEAAAKDDPGVAALVKLGDAARAEWAAYSSKNKDAIDRFLLLKDAVRSGKSNHKGYAGCYEATQPAFAKLVRATRFPWDVKGDPMPFHVSFVTATTEGYVTTVAYAACAFGQHPAGESIYTAAANQPGGGARFGARSITLAKALDPSFKPAFADRSLRFDSMAFEWKYGMTMPGANSVTAIMTPGGGVVGSMKPEGNITKITFKGNSVDACLEWVETNRVAQVTPNGSVSYEKTCKKRGQIANQASAVSVPSKYLGGISVGVSIITVDQFPVVAWKGKKITGVLGIAMR
ncbi:MAG TPA: hypothetical protein VFT22_37150 [Kofleriaceae bacterium]|nr:hypothetical protein [Kofleriaceae bacterium]